MLKEKAMRVFTLDCVNRYVPSLKPPTEMLNRLNVSLNGVMRVAAIVQIAHESFENNGEMALRHPATRKCPFEVVCDHGNRRKSNAFSTICHSSSYSFLSQIKAKSTIPTIAPNSILPN
jgi:hypothetical protein